MLSIINDTVDMEAVEKALERKKRKDGKTKRNKKS